MSWRQMLIRLNRNQTDSISTVLGDVGEMRKVTMSNMRSLSTLKCKWVSVSKSFSTVSVRMRMYSSLVNFSSRKQGATKVVEDNYAKKWSATLLPGNPFKSLRNVGSYSGPDPRHGLGADSGAKLPAWNVTERGYAQSSQTQEIQSQAHCNVAAMSQVAVTGTRTQVLGDGRVHLPIKGRWVYHVEMSGKDVDSRILSLVYRKAKSFIRFGLCYLVKSVVSRQQEMLTHLMSVQGRYCQRRHRYILLALYLGSSYACFF